MRTLIVYESMYGNTRRVAEHIAAGLAPAEVIVVAAHEVNREQLAAADLVVVGAPTHVHGLPRPSTRRGAVDHADELALEPDATANGVRELMRSLADGSGALAAAFDTRVDVPPLLSGRASKAIAKDLRDRGYRLLVGPESFLVDSNTQLLPGELDRARAFGASLARSFSETTQMA